MGGHVQGVCYGGEGEIGSVMVLVRAERQVCGTTSQVPNMLLLLAMPQRFNSTALGAVQYLQFPLNPTDHDLPSHCSPFPLQITFYSVFYKRSDGTFLYLG